MIERVCVFIVISIDRALLNRLTNEQGAGQSQCVRPCPCPCAYVLLSLLSPSLDQKVVARARQGEGGPHLLRVGRVRGIGGRAPHHLAGADGKGAEQRAR